MGHVIGVVSQKGGVGKSTLCRTLACALAKKNLSVKIADLDPSQATCMKWNAKRLKNEISPKISVELFHLVSKALVLQTQCELLILDGAPRATRATLEIAKASQMLILPTGTSLDDLEPTLKLVRELIQNQVSLNRMYIHLSQVGESKLEIQEARAWMIQAGLNVLKGELQEKTSYKRALDQGYSLTETRYKSLNKKANSVVKEIKQQLKTLTK